MQTNAIEVEELGQHHPNSKPMLKKQKEK